MERTEITCPYCHQVNIRYGGWAARIMNPRRNPNLCSMCGTDLFSAPHGGPNVLYAPLMYFAVYVLHGLIGFIIGFLLPVVFAAMVREWLPKTVIQALAVIAWPAAVCGAAIGVWRAERARRAGTLIASAVDNAGAADSVEATRHSVYASPLIPWFLLLFAGPISLYMGYQDFRLIRYGSQVDGVIINKNVSPGKSSTDTVTIAFPVASGNTAQFATQGEKRLAVGDRVPVLYIPNEINSADIATRSELYLPMIIKLAIGIACMGGSLAIWLIRLKRRATFSERHRTDGS